MEDNVYSWEYAEELIENLKELIAAMSNPRPSACC